MGPPEIPCPGLEPSPEGTEPEIKLHRVQVRVVCQATAKDRFGTKAWDREAACTASTRGPTRKQARTSQQYRPLHLPGQMRLHYKYKLLPRFDNKSKTMFLKLTIPIYLPTSTNLTPD